MLYISSLTWLRWLSLLYTASSVSHFNRKPHIVLMMVDDMGWSDVSYNGDGQIMTPNIDSLAYLSTILNQYYSEAVCTPARTALLTGIYPLKLGMYGQPLRNSEERGIPLKEKLLPSYLKEQGYKTHLVGKWHVGMHSKLFLPTDRGYDTHYGIRGAAVDYYTYIREEAVLMSSIFVEDFFDTFNYLARRGTNSSEVILYLLPHSDLMHMTSSGSASLYIEYLWPDGREIAGFDFFDNDIPQYGEQRYIVHALTDRVVDIIHRHNDSHPLFLHVAHNAPHVGNNGSLIQPPLYSSVKNGHIVNPNRRLYAEIISSIDASVGKIVNALFDNNMLDNTIIVFLSDNGAPTVGRFANSGVNLPFRGLKYTPWEGAVRVPAFIWCPSIKPKVWNGLIHITDVLPTLMSVAGVTIDKKIDGVNQWDSIRKNLTSRRKDVLVAYEETEDVMYAAYRAGDYKIILGTVSSLLNGYYGENFLSVKGDIPDYYSAIKTSDVTITLKNMGYRFNKETVTNVRKKIKYDIPNSAHAIPRCEPRPDRGCLYNINKDPSETQDLWETETDIVNTLTAKLKIILAEKQVRAPYIHSIASDPVNFNYTWMPWIIKD